jgi:hypothetical protein
MSAPAPAPKHSFGSTQTTGALDNGGGTSTALLGGATTVTTEANAALVLNQANLQMFVFVERNRVQRLCIHHNKNYVY